MNGKIPFLFKKSPDFTDKKIINFVFLILTRIDIDLKKIECSFFLIQIHLKFVKRWFHADRNSEKVTLMDNSVSFFGKNR